jgi:hypothetical protein
VNALQKEEYVIGTASALDARITMEMIMKSSTPSRWQTTGIQDTSKESLPLFQPEDVPARSHPVGKITANAIEQE